MYAPIWGRVFFTEQSTRHQPAANDWLTDGVCVVCHDEVWIIEAESEEIFYPSDALAYLVLSGRLREREDTFKPGSVCPICTTSCIIGRGVHEAGGPSGEHDGTFV